MHFEEEDPSSWHQYSVIEHIPDVYDIHYLLNDIALLDANPQLELKSAVPHWIHGNPPPQKHKTSCCNVL